MSSSQSKKQTKRTQKTTERPRNQKLWPISKTNSCINSQKLKLESNFINPIMGIYKILQVTSTGWKTECFPQAKKQGYQLSSLYSTMNKKHVFGEGRDTFSFACKVLQISGGKVIWYKRVWRSICQYFIVLKAHGL